MDRGRGRIAAVSDVQASLEEYRSVREVLVAGKIASHPALIRFGARLTHGGGADVAGW